MAHFYASIQGNRSGRTAMGTKNSGIEGHVRGWNIGGRVYVSYNEATGQDEVTIYITGGSNGGNGSKRLGTWTLNKKGTNYKKISK